MVQWLGAGGQNEQTAAASTTIHWMSVMTQLWMNINCNNNTWFHLW
jgi:hypothetical protein